jgi:GntR family transcriptional regulator
MGKKAQKRKFQRKPGNPLYLQIKEDMLAKVESGQWAENHQIPTEAELCEEYGVSTITIREALKHLVQDGIFIRRAGKGTFVTKPRLIQEVSSLFSITRWNPNQKGIKIITKIIKFEMQECNQEIADQLLIPEGAEVTRVERLRLGNDEPLMFQIIWFPSRLCPDLHLQDMTDIPIHDLLRDVYHIPLVNAIETIEPTIVDDYVKRVMGLKKKTLLLLVEHKAYTVNNKIVLYATSFCRGDRYKFWVDLKSH